MSAPFDITSAEIKKNILFLNVHYGGGCENHDFIAEWEPNWKESLPVTTDLRIIHIWPILLDYVRPLKLKK